MYDYPSKKLKSSKLSGPDPAVLGGGGRAVTGATAAARTGEGTIGVELRSDPTGRVEGGGGAMLNPRVTG